MGRRKRGEKTGKKENEGKGKVGVRESGVMLKKD